MRVVEELWRSGTKEPCGGIVEEESRNHVEEEELKVEEPRNPSHMCGLVWNMRLEQDVINQHLSKI